MSLFGFDFEQAKKEYNDSMPKNLTAGKYKLMVTAVEEGVHPFGGQFSSGCANPIDPDKEIRISCVLVDPANGFKEGWKHTLFFSPNRPDKEKPGNLSVRALIDRAQLADVTLACCGKEPKSTQELVQKMFYVTLKESTGKDGKTYLNIDKVESLMGSETSQPMPLSTASAATPAVDTTGVAEPDWR